jgi:hypothetical protein
VAVTMRLKGQRRILSSRHWGFGGNRAYKGNKQVQKEWPPEVKMPRQSRYQPLAFGLARITRGQPTSLLNRIFSQYSLPTLPACLIPHLLPPSLPFNPPKESVKIQWVASANGRGTLCSPVTLIGMRVYMAYGQQFTYCINPHPR